VLGAPLGNTVSGLGSTVGGLLGAGSNSPSPSAKPTTQPKPSARPPPPPVIVVPPPVEFNPTVIAPRPPKPSGTRGGDRDNNDRDEEDQGARDNEHKDKKSRLSVYTKGTGVLCRTYADTISTDPSRIPTFQSGTRLDVTCYTQSGMMGISGNVQGDSTWLKTNKGCFVNRAEVQSREDFKAILDFCPAPPHWVGTLMGQYTRVDCYDCTSLDCPSRNIGSPPYVDLACSLKGEAVQGNG
jgi:hypothetical protein